MEKSKVFSDQLCKAYFEHFKKQQGGSLGTFQGSRFQSGEGLGDIFRAVGRFLFPIFSSGASRFITSTASGLNSGQNLKDAAKSAIGPTMNDVLSNAGDAVMKKMSGSGRKRRRTKRGVYKGQPKRKRRKSTKQKGKGRKRSNRKRRNSKRKKRQRVLKTNF